MEKDKDLEFKNGLIKVIIKVNGKMIKQMEKVNFIMLMDLCMKEP
jgi:hypothetical protein